jgi:hypothetical protein
MFKPNEQPELPGLDLPPIVPVWPRPGTMPEFLLEILLRDGSTTVDKFAAETGSHEVRKNASILRDYVWPIVVYSKRAPVKRLQRRTIALYTLDIAKIDFTKVVRP